MSKPMLARVGHSLRLRSVCAVTTTLTTPPYIATPGESLRPSLLGRVSRERQVEEPAPGSAAALTLEVMSTDAAQWWAAPSLRGELEGVLELLNAGRRHLVVDEERTARKFCDALNRAWNARASEHGADPDASDWSRLKELVCDLPLEDGLALLRSEELAVLVSIDPPVLDHKMLLKRGFLGSAVKIPDEVRRQAADAHLRLRRRLEEMSASPSAEEARRSLTRVASFLYVIRSNLQHGEKFASPDPHRIARDRVIAEKAGHVFELFFDLLFARPSRCLAAYGALAPGGALHAELERAGGKWVAAVVRGWLRNGLQPALTPSQAGDGVDVHLLRGAPGLPDLWTRLDQLEGDAYVRLLVPTETSQGDLLVANLYAAASQVQPREGSA